MSETQEPSSEFVTWAKEAMQAEIAGARTTVVIGPWSAFELIGALQLVTRHPDVAASTKNHMRAFGNQFSEWFKGTPAEEVIRRGWDPSFDVDRAGRHPFVAGEHVWSHEVQGDPSA